MTPIRFQAKLWKPEGVGVGTFVTLPRSASAKLGAKGRVPIEGTINGFAFRSSAFADGEGSHLIQVNATMRAGAKAEPGDTAEFSITPASDDVAVKVPADVTKALRARPAAKKQWADITPKAREEFVAWIASAKKDDTRARRIEMAVERLAAGARRLKD